MKINNKLFNPHFEWPLNPDLLDDYQLIADSNICEQPFIESLPPHQLFAKYLNKISQ